MKTSAQRTTYSEPQGSPPPGSTEQPVRATVRDAFDDDAGPVAQVSRLQPPMTPPPMTSGLRSIEEDAAKVLEKVLIMGDLADLSAEERVTYVKAVCESLGLNPFTRPFAYIVLDNKLTLYARRDCADQLRRIHGISIEVVGKKLTQDDIFTVHVRAMDRYGRVDEDIGSVDLFEKDGQKRADAMMKAITKAKRRVTLSIAGLGFLDESEVGDVIEHEATPKKTQKKKAKSKSQPLVTISPPKPGEKRDLPPRVGGVDAKS